MICGRQGLIKYKYKDKHKDKYKDKYKDKDKYKYTQQPRLLYVFGREMIIGV